MSEFKSQEEYFNAATSPTGYVKPIVHYRPYPGALITVGDYASIIPADHPATYLNGSVAYTSTVLSVGPDGSFETRNTRYVLEK